MSDPVGYLQEMDAMACQACDTRKRLDAEVAQLRKRRDDLLTSNNEFEQRYREAKAKADTLRAEARAAAALDLKVRNQLQRCRQGYQNLLELRRNNWELIVIQPAEIAEAIRAIDIALAPMPKTVILSDYRDKVIEEIAQAFGPEKLFAAEIRAMKGQAK
jgi:uncharacterized coiled-coil DUF342 family protein